MKNYKIITVLIAVFFITSCGQKQGTEGDVIKLNPIDTVGFAKLNSEVGFWEDKLNNSNQFTYHVQLGNALMNRFDALSNPQDIIRAQQHLNQANLLTEYSNCAILRTTARNLMTQHRFEEAQKLLFKADSIGEDPEATKLMLFDVALELGEEDRAEYYIPQSDSNLTFHWLVRLAKLQDTKGELSSAINTLKKALVIAQEKNIQSWEIWTLSNLGDFSGHQGNINAAMSYYKQVLRLDPNNIYTRKQLAYLHFANERNAQEAKNVLTELLKYSHDPSIQFLLARIEILDGDQSVGKQQLVDLDQFLDNLNSPSMYGALRIETNVLLGRTDAARQMAGNEMKNRPGPGSAAWLAWTLYLNGEKDSAGEIIEEEVIGNTYEPIPLWIAAQVIEDQKVKSELLNELDGAEFELGPDRMNQLTPQKS